MLFIKVEKVFKGWLSITNEKRVDINDKERAINKEKLIKRRKVIRVLKFNIIRNKKKRLEK